MEVAFKKSFLRALKAFPEALQEDIIQAMEDFKDVKNHKRLRVHALKGQLKGCYSFWVNFRYRIVFEYEENKRTAVLLAVGDHSVYE